MFWNADDSSDAARQLVDYVRAGDNVNASRREAALDYASLYEGSVLGSLAPHGYAVDRENRKFPGTDVPIIRNTCHAVVDTFVSKIGALDTPKPAMLTTDGSWKDRRQAKELERLVEAEYLSPKGTYSTLHELCIQALRIAAAATGTVAVRVWNDNGKVNAAINDTLSAVLSSNGRTTAIVTWYEVDDLVERFPEREMDIRAAKQEPPLEYRMPKIPGTIQHDMVALYEGWRGALGEAPGTYLAALDSNCDPLVHEDYMSERPPLAILSVDPHLYGPYANSLTHHAYESVYRQNALLQSVDRSISKTSRQVTYAHKEAVDPGQLEQIEDNLVVYVNAAGYEPKTSSPLGFHPGMLSVIEQHEQAAHDITGVSQMHSGGKKEPGIDSAIGQRTVAALINERFAAVQRRYVQFCAVDLAKLVIQALCEIYQDDRKMTRHWPGKDSLREVSAAVALRGIEALKYQIQPAAVSGSKGSPADRAQQAFEFFKSGLLSQDSYAAVQTSGYDLPEEIDSRDTQREWLDRQMDRYQFASDKEVARPNFYVPPLKHMNPERSILRIIDGFLEAQMSGLEDDRLEYYLMLLADFDSIIQQSAPLDQQTAQQSQQVAQLPS
jgi:hypothetical protein